MTTQEKYWFLQCLIGAIIALLGGFSAIYLTSVFTVFFGGFLFVFGSIVILLTIPKEEAKKRVL